MPLFMDVHIVEGATSEALAKAHAEDLLVQGNHGVEYTKYWFNEREGKIFCLCTAPNAEAADRVHREAHGLQATKIIEVEPELVEAFLGAAAPNAAGAAVLPAGGDRDTGTRTVLFTDIVGSTSLTQEHGDEVAMRIVQAHDAKVRGAESAAMIVGGERVASEKLQIGGPIQRPGADPGVERGRGALPQAPTRLPGARRTRWPRAC